LALQRRTVSLYACQRAGYSSDHYSVECREATLVALKVCTSDEETTQEFAISHHIKSIEADHPGKQRLRVALDGFQLNDNSHVHQCLVFAPLGLTYTQFRNMFPSKALDKDLLKQSLLMIFLGLDFSHQAGVVHTGKGQ
jgi:hypothetical protein